MASLLEVNFYHYLSLEICIEHLKLAKKEYLIKKKDHLKFREKYLTDLKTKASTLRLRNERVKQCWRILRKHFRKQKLQSISRVEFIKNSLAIIILN